MWIAKVVEAGNHRLEYERVSTFDMMVAKDPCAVKTIGASDSRCYERISRLLDILTVAVDNPEVHVVAGWG